MRALYDRTAARGRGFRSADLLAAASEVAGGDPAELFDAYVFGKEILPVEACLGRAGLAASSQPYAGEMWVRRASGATDLERRVLEAIVGSR